MSDIIEKYEAKVIAQVLIAKIGETTDGFAFDDCGDMLSEKEKEMIMKEIEKICESTIKRIEKKYGFNLGRVNSTQSIIEEILYQSEIQ